MWWVFVILIDDSWVYQKRVAKPFVAIATSNNGWKSCIASFTLCHKTWTMSENHQKSDEEEKSHRSWLTICAQLWCQPKPLEHYNGKYGTLDHDNWLCEGWTKSYLRVLEAPSPPVAANVVLHHKQQTWKFDARIIRVCFRFKLLNFLFITE